MTEYRTDFSFIECKLLIEIAKSLGKDEVIQSDLARSIDISPTSPTFTKIFKYLVEVKIVEKHKTVGQCILLKIDEDKLTDLIDEQTVTKFMFDYFNEWHFISW